MRTHLLWDWATRKCTDWMMEKYWWTCSGLSVVQLHLKPISSRLGRNLPTPTFWNTKMNRIQSITFIHCGNCTILYTPFFEALGPKINSNGHSPLLQLYHSLHHSSYNPKWTKHSNRHCYRSPHLVARGTSESRSLLQAICETLTRCCWSLALLLHVILSEWLAFYSMFWTATKVVYL